MNKPGRKFKKETKTQGMQELMIWKIFFISMDRILLSHCTSSEIDTVHFQDVQFDNPLVKVS